VIAVDETTFRILDTLTRELGKPLSILELTRKIEHFHGTAYYANVYEKLRKLAAQGTITLQKTGRSSVASLNFSNYFLLDLLTEMELIRKRTLLEKRAELQILFADVDGRCRELPFIQSISLLHPERNIKLNKSELLVLLKRQDSDERRRLRESISRVQRAHNIRIDLLPLTTAMLLDLLASDEKNPLRGMLPDSVCVLSPQAFWSEIIDAERKGLGIRLEENETDPRKLSENEVVYNLARFGYKEFGKQAKQSEKILKELLAVSLLLRGDTRRIDAVSVILGKSKTRWDLLVFLAQRCGAGGRLLGLLRALNRIKSAKEIGEAIEALEWMNVEEVKVDEKRIEDRLRLYNVVG